VLLSDSCADGNCRRCVGTFINDDDPADDSQVCGHPCHNQTVVEGSGTCRAGPEGIFWPSLGRAICDDREDPEQSPCIRDPGHSGLHEDEYGEYWCQPVADEGGRV